MHDVAARPRPALDAGAFLYLAWVVALAATLGALFVEWVLGQAPCHLCWWQRVAMFPLAVILGVAALSGEVGAWRQALPLALGGLAVALYHSGLYLGLIPEPIVPCTATGPSCTDASMAVLGVPLPVLSAIAFALVAAGLLAAARAPSETRP